MAPLAPWTSGLQVGMNSLDCYEQDFEAAMLEASAEYFKRKAAAWIQARCATLRCQTYCVLHRSALLPWSPRQCLHSGRQSGPATAWHGTLQPCSQQAGASATPCASAFALQSWLAMRAQGQGCPVCQRGLCAASYFCLPGYRGLAQR